MSRKKAGGGGTYDKYFGEIPPESTEFGWPLYITVPFDELLENIPRVIYKKACDSISAQLIQWCHDNFEVVDEDWFLTFYEVQFPELYVNGVKIKQATADVSFDESLDDATIMLIPENSTVQGNMINEILLHDYEIYISLQLA